MDLFITFTGFMAAFLSTFASIPQFLKIYRTRNTSSLATSFCIMLFSSLVCRFVYGIGIDEWPIILPTILGISQWIFILCVKFGNIKKGIDS